jgi:hypothetical protein
MARSRMPIMLSEQTSSIARMRSRARITGSIAGDDHDRLAKIAATSKGDQFALARFLAKQQFLYSRYSPAN